MNAFSRFGNIFGKRRLELAAGWLPSGATYGAAAFIALIYFTDWRIIATKIPIYNIKFKDEEN